MVLWAIPPKDPNSLDLREREGSQNEMRSVTKQSNSITNVWKAYWMKWGKDDADLSNFWNEWMQKD